MSTTRPISLMTPLSMTATRWQISLTTAISWVMTTIVMPRRLLMSWSSSRMDFVVCGSRADVAEQDFRIAGQGTGNADALFLAA